MLEAIENFLATIAHNFIKPRTAINRDEQRAFVQTGRLGVGDDAGVNEVIPDFGDFSLGAAAVHAHINEDLGHDVGNLASANEAGFFEGVGIHAAPLREDALPGAVLGRAEFVIAIGLGNYGHDRFAANETNHFILLFSGSIFLHEERQINRILTQTWRLDGERVNG
jgi:hypothetical protein